MDKTMTNGDLEFIKNKFVERRYKVIIFDADNTLYKVDDPRLIYDKALEGLDWCFSFKIGELYDTLRTGFRSNSMEAWWYSKHMWFVVLNMLQNLGCKKREIKPSIILEIFRESKKIYDKFINILTKQIRLTDIGKKVALLNKKFILVVLSEEERAILDKKLEATNLKDQINFSISSTEAGYLKPHERYFEIFFKNFPNIQREEVLYIDDLQENVKFAESKIGIDALTEEQFRELLEEDSY
ncbi:MAG: HAD family hydrolase [Candidatus Njordarchaeia archaeon]